MLTRKGLIVAAALIGIASSMTVAQAQTAVYRNGRVVDSQGWRYSNGWENGCFRSLGYLNSSDACGGASGE